MSLSLVVVTDGAHLDNLRRTIDSCRDIIQETVVVYQGTDYSVHSQIQGMSDFSVITTPKGNADPDRNFAYGIAQGDWILALDDDEYIEDETKQFIVRIMDSKVDVVWFDFKNLVDGVDIHEILGDDAHPRLWRRKEGLINWPTQAHAYPQIASPLQYFTKTPIVHDRKFDELYARHEKRTKMMDQGNIELEKRFIAALKQKLGKK
jgi:glycosyltransferase involved in cell wall biosynthesis